MQVLLNATYKHILILFALPLAAGLILTILAPLGTHRFTLGSRAFYWIGLCLAGGLGAGLFDLLNRKFSLTQKTVFIAFAHSIFATIAVAAFIFFLFVPSSLLSALATLFYIWMIAIVISGIGGLIGVRNTPAPAPIDARPALYERLSPKLRNADIYAITSEDHYVRVYTSAGDEMIFMRLSDAVKETAPLRGLTPHRSWWVAEAGVESAKRRDSKTVLVLKNGITALVSRNGMKALKEAGWV